MQIQKHRRFTAFHFPAQQLGISIISNPISIYLSAKESQMKLLASQSQDTQRCKRSAQTNTNHRAQSDNWTQLFVKFVIIFLAQRRLFWSFITIKCDKMRQIYKREKEIKQVNVILCVHFAFCFRFGSFLCRECKGDRNKAR